MHRLQRDLIQPHAASASSSPIDDRNSVLAKNGRYTLGNQQLGIDRNPLQVNLNPALQTLLTSRRVLMLQGPVGPFFERLTSWLVQHDVAVSRVVFQRGDEADCSNLKPIKYTGSLTDWQKTFEDLLRDLTVDCVLLFGQFRRYHTIAIEQARQRDVPVVVLEEGYFRPGFATAELGGVNAHSSSLSLYQFDNTAPGLRVAFGQPEFGQNQFLNTAYYAARHYLAMRTGRGAYPNYVHHRGESIRHYLWHWTRSGVAKAWHYRRNRQAVGRLSQQRYYFAPLQHDGDPQIKHHSPFNRNTDFIEVVLRSFKAKAPSDTRLIFREHPMSRGASGESKFLSRLARQLCIADRVEFLVDGHTPTLVKNAAGVVVINSTVGLLALEHRRPLKVLGGAMYNQHQLSFQKSLDDFWLEFSPPDEESAAAFLFQLRGLTQWPCNLYGRAKEPLRWHVEPSSPAPASLDHLLRSS